jgi:hypothetical protein
MGIYEEAVWEHWCVQAVVESKKTLHAARKGERPEDVRSGRPKRVIARTTSLTSGP